MERGIAGANVAGANVAGASIAGASIAGASIAGANVAGASIVGIGVDTVDVSRFRRSLARTPSLAERVFTADELRYARQRRDPTQPLAARFAAKEAVMKCMGVGIGACDTREIEVTRADSGAPAIVLHGRAVALAHERGITIWLLSLTHTDISAVAFAMALR